MHQKQNYSVSGFTLIELIIVIVILSTLSVVAAARLVDFSDDALDARVKSRATNLKSNIRLMRAKHEIDGNSTQLIGNSIIHFNDEGYPESSTNDNQGCADIWKAAFSEADSIYAPNSFSISEPGWYSLYGNTSFCLFIYFTSSRTSNVIGSPYILYFPTTMTFTLRDTRHEGVAGDIFIGSF